MEILKNNQLLWILILIVSCQPKSESPQNTLQENEDRNGLAAEEQLPPSQRDALIQEFKKLEAQSVGDEPGSVLPSTDINGVYLSGYMGVDDSRNHLVGISAFCGTSAAFALCTEEEMLDVLRINSFSENVLVMSSNTNKILISEVIVDPSKLWQSIIRVNASNLVPGESFKVTISNLDPMSSNVEEPDDLKEISTSFPAMPPLESTRVVLVFNPNGDKENGEGAEYCLSRSNDHFGSGWNPEATDRLPQAVTCRDEGGNLFATRQDPLRSDPVNFILNWSQEVGGDGAFRITTEYLGLEFYLEITSWGRPNFIRKDALNNTGSEVFHFIIENGLLISNDRKYAICIQTKDSLGPFDISTVELQQIYNLDGTANSFQDKENYAEGPSTCILNPYRELAGWYMQPIIDGE